MTVFGYFPNSEKEELQRQRKNAIKRDDLLIMNEFFLEYARIFQLTTHIKHILLHIEKKEKVSVIKNTPKRL